ncbi:MAG: crosslink repair DNA glycosylase YcaQ family protein [Aggregatilineales bacterium]
MLTLSQDAVRGVMIAAMGLRNAPQPPATKDDILSVIRQLHMLQIDSISVVARAPYFVLWSRLGDFNPDWLDELFEDGALFEYYAHANCYLPIEDFPLFRAGVSRVIDWRNPRRWLEEHSTVTEAVMAHIRTNGDTRHTEFKPIEGEIYTWDNPKAEQTALEYLVYTFDLMVRRRENFQRVYDLRERVFPDADKLPTVSLVDARDQLVLYTIQAMGVTKTEWIAGYYRFKTAWVNASLKRLEKQDRVIQVAVEGWDKPAYVHPDHVNMVEAAANGDIPQSKTTLLSPFDPLVWDRGRTLDLFDFDFPIEFYFPANKRKYGYFSLPILYNNRLIGRVDPKANRKKDTFEIKTMHLEPDVEVDEPLIFRVKRVIQACADWHDTPQVVMDESVDPELIEMFSD